MKKVLSLMTCLATFGLLTSCGIINSNSPSTDESVSVDSEVDVNETIKSVTYKAEGGETYITLSDGNSSSTGDNASLVTINNSSNTITITSVGTYVLSGTLSEGNIIISASVNGSDDEVVLIINGISITSSKYSPIYSSGDTHLKVKKYNKSVNLIKDNREETLADSSEASAAIYSEKKLEVVGGGELGVIANHNGLGTNKSMELKNGTLNIEATNNGIRAERNIDLGDATDKGNISIKSSNANAIKEEVDADEMTTSYPLTFSSGNFIINSKYDGVQTNQDIVINDGAVINITAGGGASNSASSTYSYKGLKADNSIVVNGGEINVSSADDSLHTNGDISILGGSVKVESGDDGIHADDTLTISGDSTYVGVYKSYEGLEATTVNINGGTNYIVSSDDGINAAGGSDTASGHGGWGVQSSSGTLNINGGYVFVMANGDGLDSNGDIYFTGGTTIVSQYGNGNCALDCGDNNNSIYQNGGFVAAYGTYDSQQTSG